MCGVGVVEHSIESFNSPCSLLFIRTDEVEDEDDDDDDDEDEDEEEEELPFNELLVV